MRLGFHSRFGIVVLSLLVCASLFQAASPPPDAMTVRLPEGLVRGFLVLRTLDDAVIAEPKAEADTTNRGK